MKTADLQRSKRLKELGWKQEGSWEFSPKGHYWPYGECVKFHTTFKQDQMTVAPAAGEMIEWLLGEDCWLNIGDHSLVLNSRHEFLLNDNLCNALADACAWVKERKM